jgi:hypothetical protein
VKDVLAAVERRPEAHCPAIDPFVLERGQGKIVGGGDIPGPSQTGESTLSSQAFGFRDETLAALLERATTPSRSNPGSAR